MANIHVEVQELLEDAMHHLQSEGVNPEVRGRAGWFDLTERLARIHALRDLDHVFIAIQHDGHLSERRWQGIHHPKVCAEDSFPCPFHSPSNHPLKDAQMVLVEDSHWLVLRVCEHWVRHPDPDSVAQRSFALGKSAPLWQCVCTCHCCTR